MRTARISEQGVRAVAFWKGGKSCEITSQSRWPHACCSSLREQTATLCEEMLQSINDGKTDGVHQKTLNRLTRFIEQFKQMNFANDAEMEAQLEQVRRELLTRTAAEYRDSRSAQRSLRQGLGDLAGKARELAQADARELVQQFGQLGQRRFHLAA